MTPEKEARICRRAVDPRCRMGVFRRSRRGAPGRRRRPWRRKGAVTHKKAEAVTLQEDGGDGDPGGGGPPRPSIREGGFGSLQTFERRGHDPGP